MKISLIKVITIMLFFTINSVNEEESRIYWANSPIEVSQKDGYWHITGEKQNVILNTSNFQMTIESSDVKWQMFQSDENDLQVEFMAEKFYLSLIDAGKVTFEEYDTGFSKGIKIRLSQFRSNGLYHKGSELDLTLVLKLALEGPNEDLVNTVIAIENDATVRKLNWPKALDASNIDYTALPHVRGNLLPSDWPELYHPFGSNVPSAEQTSFTDTETSYIQSNLIETWSMSWWGFQKENSAMMLIVETPDDAAYEFDHPAGGPTIIGPSWLASLGELDYPRSVRMCFFSNGDYVDMAKRYRKYVKDIGQFVSLEEKIAKEPKVQELIGTPHLRMHILRNYHESSQRYDHENPENNYRLTTFEESAQELRELKEAGLDNVYITLAGWPNLGYDTEHPDVLPPAPDAGGWEGFKKWFDTADELGFLANLHDQYRDYYVVAPSYDPQFALHEEDIESAPTIFPGTRFGTWKEGHLSFMNYWDGGKMTYLNPRIAIGHLIKNYEIMAWNNINPVGSYLDVFGYVPPTEDFNPENPLTRRQNMDYRARMFKWVRNNLGIVGTESAADWTIPYVDYSSHVVEGATIAVPLYTLVYHDAILTPGGRENDLRTLLIGGFPYVPRDIENEEDMQILRVIIALHRRVGLLEMTNHEFLDDNYQVERTTFSDGTMVIINRITGTYEITPELTIE